MASLIKRGRKWYVKLYDHRGRQKWVRGYSDKSETERLARQLEDREHRIRIGDVDPQAEVRRRERSKAIDAQIEDYELKLMAAGRSAGHVKYTIADVKKLVDFSGCRNPLDRITSASAVTVGLVDRWVVALGEAGKDSNKTINRRVASVQQFLRHLAEVGGVTQYVLNRYPKLPTGDNHRKRRSRALTRDEAEKLLGAEVKEYRRQVYAFAYRTGLRMNECRQMTPACFDFEHGTITVPAHVAKARRDQVIPMHRSLVETLNAVCGGKAADQPVFIIPDKKCVNRNLRADCGRVGVDAKDVSFHSLRHTFCTLLARANVHPALLQKLARHADLKTTLTYYVHLQRSDEQEAIDKL